MRTRSTLVAVLAVSVALVGCGSDSETSGPATTLAPSTTTTALDAAADRVTASSYLLVKSDVPAGWSESPAPADDPATDALTDEMNACAGLPPTAETEVVSVSGPVFSQDNNVITSGVTSRKTAELARQDFAASIDPKNFPCLADGLNKVVEKELAGTVPGLSASSTVSKLEGITSGTDQYALRATSTLKAGGQTFPVYTDTLVILNDRFETSINVTYFASVPPAELEQALLGSVLARISGAKQA